MPRPSSSQSPRFLLDENLSRRVAEALRLCDYAVTHVRIEPELGPGTPDEDIVPWCGRTGHTWVTVDHDARARHIRFALLGAYRVNAILLHPEPKGIRAQLERIVRHYDEWMRIIAARADEHRVWIQRVRGELRRL